MKMQKLIPLNKKQVKELLENIRQQYGVKKLDLDYIFFKSPEGNIFLLSNDFKDFKYENLNINSLGLYFASVKGKNIRLSIEGGQMIGNNANKNVLELNDDEIRDWLRGDDLDTREKDGYFIIKNKADFYGCGKISNGKLMNYVPKERRMESI